MFFRPERATADTWRVGLRPVVRHNHRLELEPGEPVPSEGAAENVATGVTTLPDLFRPVGDYHPDEGELVAVFGDQLRPFTTLLQPIPRRSSYISKSCESLPCRHGGIPHSP